MKKLKSISFFIICITYIISCTSIYAKNQQKRLPILSIFNYLEGPLLTKPLYPFSFNVQLFYGDLFSSEVETYTISPDHFAYEETPYISFCEGFIETDKNEKLLEAVNRYRMNQGLECITSYYNYHELEGYGFLSLTDGLSTLYRVDLATYEVICPIFPEDISINNQCIYHIMSDNDHYYVLGKMANSNEVILYAINKDTFSLCTMKEIPSPKTARYIQDFALDNNGNLYFIEEDQIVITNTYYVSYLPLTFKPEMLYANGDTIYAFKTSNLLLNYAVFNESEVVSELHQVNLPNQFVSLVSLKVKDNVLYTLTCDALHPVYRYYLTLYDLTDNHMLYCCAFSEPNDTNLTLMGASIKP